MYWCFLEIDIWMLYWGLPQNGYTDRHANYRGQAFDQLADVIHKMWTKLDDRHIILSVWNPADVQLMAIPPCHILLR
jgi:thymidylate synthase